MSSYLSKGYSLKKILIREGRALWLIWRWQKARVCDLRLGRVWTTQGERYLGKKFHISCYNLLEGLFCTCEPVSVCMYVWQRVTEKERQRQAQRKFWKNWLQCNEMNTILWVDLGTSEWMQTVKRCLSSKPAKKAGSQNLDDAVGSYYDFWVC